MCASFFNLIFAGRKRIETTKLLQMFFSSLLTGFRRCERIFRCFEGVVSHPGHTLVIDSNLLNYMGFNGQA